MDESAVKSRTSRWTPALLILDGGRPWASFEQKRRGRLLLGVALIVTAVGSFRSLLFLTASAYPQAAVLGTAAVLSATVVLGVRRRWPSVLTENLQILILFSTAVSIGVYRGWIGAPVLAALGVVPLLATQLSGWRGGLAWLTTCLCTVLGIGLAEAAGFELVDQVRSGAQFGLDLTASAVIIVVLFVLGSLSVWSKQAALAEAARADRERHAAVEHVKHLRGDRMASMGTMAAGVGHEINNPLSYVVANLAFVRDHLVRTSGAAPDATEVDDVLGALDDAQEGAERIRKIVASLSDFSRGEQDGPRAALAVGDAVTAALNLVGNEIRHRATLECDLDSSRLVHADEPRLVQVLVNLLLNALDALDESTERRVEVRTWDEADSVHVSVRDNGPGVDPDQLEQIFVPFFTTKGVGKGTGLGLSICRSIITDHGGTIEVQSTLGEGSVFTISLPQTDDVAQPAPAPAAGGEEAVERRLRVLLIDDEPLVLSALKRALRSHDIEIAAGGRAALDRLEQRRDFDLILCDLMMPDVTGMDVFEEAARRFPDLTARFAFLTGGAFTDAAREFVDRVDRPVFTKPVQLDALKELLEGSSTATREPARQG